MCENLHMPMYVTVCHEESAMSFETGAAGLCWDSWLAVRGNWDPDSGVHECALRALSHGIASPLQPRKLLSGNVLI